MAKNRWEIPKVDELYYDLGLDKAKNKLKVGD